MEYQNNDIIIHPNYTSNWCIYRKYDITHIYIQNTPIVYKYFICIEIFT